MHPQPIDYCVSVNDLVLQWQRHRRCNPGIARRSLEGVRDDCRLALGFGTLSPVDRAWFEDKLRFAEETLSATN